MLRRLTKIAALRGEAQGYTSSGTGGVAEPLLISCCTFASFVCRRQNTFGNVWSSRLGPAWKPVCTLNRQPFFPFGREQETYEASEESEESEVAEDWLPSGCTEGPPSACFQRRVARVLLTSRGGTSHGA
eukprot:s4730_g1.t1